MNRFRTAGAPGPRSWPWSVLAIGRGCDRRDQRTVGSDRDARHRPLVRDQDRRPAARFRADCGDRRPRDLRHVLHVQGRRPRASASAARAVVDGVEGCEDVRLQPAQERPLRRRHAAHVRRRGLLVPALDQPQGQSVVPARRRHGVARGRYTVILRSKTPNAALPAILTNTSLGHRQLEARAQARRHRRGRSRQERQGGEVAELRRLPRRGQRPVSAAALQHDVADHARAEPALLGLRKAAVQAVVVRNMIAADAADQHPARQARGRDRPLRRPGADDSRATSD